MSRATVVDAALGLVGLTYPADAYLAAVAPAEVAAGNLARAREMGRQSDCALLWIGGIAVGVFGAEARPYRDTTAFQVVYELAGGPCASPWHLAGAVRRPTLESPPQLGDGLVWGASAGAVAHVDAAVVDLELDGDVCALSVVAGGQRDGAGNETVKRLPRTIRWVPYSLAAGRSIGPHWVDTTNGRPLLAVLDADLMAERYP